MLKDFFSYYRPHRALFIVDFGCAILAGLLALGFPVAVKTFVDTLLPRGDWTLIVLASAGLLLVYIVHTGLMAVVTYWGHVLGISIETEMRSRAFDHIQKLSFSFFDGQKTGHLVARMTKDLEEIGEVAHHGPEDVFVALMTFVGALILMFWVHVQLALICAAIAPMALWLIVYFGGAMTRNWQEQFGRVAAFNARIEENVGGARVVRAFSNEAHERALFAIENLAYRRAKLAAYRLMAAAMTLNNLAMRVVQVGVLLAGAYFVTEGSLSIGGFVGFLLLISVFYQPLEKIAAVMEIYPKGIAGFQRYQELLAIEPDVKDAPDAVEAGRFAGAIRVSGMTFGYDPARPVLKGIDLDIRAGETVAFVGPSGAGKTTLLSLVPRFYDVGSGSISIDGTDIRAVTLASLRRQIGIVQQDVFLFAGTLRENIAYGKIDASDAEIAEAAERAELGSLVRDLPDGIDTIVGERGVKLSGGQKQRVAIARIFIRNPPILILDEATSALDTETERQIQRSLAELSRGRTTLAIAHRLATIRDADRVVVVSGGRVVEEGSYADLASRDGAFAALQRAQTFANVAPAPTYRADRVA